MNKNLLLLAGLLAVTPVVANLEDEWSARDFRDKIEACHKYNKDGKPKDQENPCDLSWRSIRALRPPAFEESVTPREGSKKEKVVEAHLHHLMDSTNPKVDGLEVQEKNLEGIILGCSDVPASYLRQSATDPVNFTYKEWKSARIAMVYGQWADLRGIKLTKVNLSKSHLANVHCANSELIEVNLNGSDLRGTNFAKALFIKVNLEDVNLYNSSFNGANFDSETIVKPSFWKWLRGWDKCVLPNGERSTKCAYELKKLIDGMKLAELDKEKDTKTN